MSQTTETAAPTAAQEQSQTQSQSEATAVQLTVADLQMVRNIIDLASRRGAFQASELSQIGAVVDKLSGFLSQVETQTPTPSEGTAA